jgi:hypothetical protein
MTFHQNQVLNVIKIAFDQNQVLLKVVKMTSHQKKIKASPKSKQNELHRKEVEERKQNEPKKKSNR